MGTAQVVLQRKANRAFSKVSQERYKIIILTLLLLQRYVLTCSSLHCVAAVVTQLFKCQLEYNHSLKTFSLRKLCLASVLILCPVQKINCELQYCIPAGSALKKPIQQQCRTSHQTRISQRHAVLPNGLQSHVPNQCNHVKGSAHAGRVIACANAAGKLTA